MVNYNTWLFVTNSGAGALTGNILNQYKSIADKDVYFVDRNGALITNAAGMVTAGGFYVVSGYAENGINKTFTSEWTPLSRVVNASKAAYVAPVQQVWAFGYDGVTASKDLVLQNNTPYMFRLSIDSDFRTHKWSDLFGPISSATTGFAGATPTYQEDRDFLNHNFVKIVNGVMEGSNVYNLQGQRGSLSSYFKAELLSSSTGTAVGTNTTIATGDTIVTTSAAHTLTSANIGQYIRLGGVATTFGLYRIKSIPSTTTIEIDQPFQGTSMVAVASGTATTEGAGNIGIKITAKPVSDHIWDGPQFIRFDGSFYQSDGTANSTSIGYSAPITELVAGKVGQGTFGQIQEKEVSLWGKKGLNFVDNFPVLPYAIDAVVGTTYAVYTINVEKAQKQSMNIGLDGITYEFAVPTGGSAATYFDGIFTTTAFPSYVLV